MCSCTVEAAAKRASVRYETPPGHQSQIDWGSARVHFRFQPVVLRMFVLTLGFSRRGFMEPTLNEQVPQFLDAHERAFDHFGGRTREHLYDRPRTICRLNGEGGVAWNPTFQRPEHGPGSGRAHRTTASLDTRPASRPHEPVEV